MLPITSLNSNSMGSISLKPKGYLNHNIYTYFHLHHQRIIFALFILLIFIVTFLFVTFYFIFSINFIISNICIPTIYFSYYIILLLFTYYVYLNLRVHIITIVFSKSLLLLLIFLSIFQFFNDDF